MICTICHMDKAEDNFYKSNHRRQCKACVAEKVRLWRLANPGKHKEADKRYRLHHPEYMGGKLWRISNPMKAKEADRARYWKNVDKNRIKARKYQHENREELSVKHRAYYYANKKKVLEKCKDWVNRNKLKVRENHRKWEERNWHKMIQAQRKSRHKAILELKDSYVKHLMKHIDIKDPNAGLIELKRKQLLFIRELRNLKEAANG